MFIPKSFENRPYAIRFFCDTVSWAKRRHPFYAKYIVDADKDVPILSRNILFENNDLILNGAPVTGKTSGSTGMPIRVSWSRQKIAAERQDNELFASWLGGAVPHIKIVSMITHEEGSNVLEVNSPIEEQVEFILSKYKEMGAISLITYPTNLEMLCNYIIEKNINMAFIKRCCCMSEVYETYHDDLVAQAFPNAVAVTTYSSVETGIIAIRCPHNPENHHIMAHKLGVEFINDTGEPCGDGEVGRIVITDYVNKMMPLIRYDIGDFAAPTKCPCQKIDLPAMTHIVGKVRGALMHRDGHRVMFTDFSVVFRDSPAVKQYQVIQEEIERFLIRFVPVEGESLELFEKTIRDSFRDQFGYDAEMVFQKESVIEREASGKFYASICNVA